MNDRARRAGSCSAIAVELGEELGGTATHARQWLLVEQPGTWGRNALLESGIDQGVARAIDEWCRERDVRPGVIQRPGATASTRRVYLADTAERSLRCADVAELDDVTRPGMQWRVEEEPLYLVCTNARRDACCGIHGRAAFTALSESRPDQTWQTSHVGGHRFAANLLCLPDGLSFGRVKPEGAVAIVESYERGRIILDHFRGRTALSGPAQAAEIYARRHTGAHDVDDVTVDGGSTSGDLSTIEVTTPQGRLVVDVRETPASPPRIESCGAQDRVQPPTYSLIGIRRS